MKELREFKRFILNAPATIYPDIFYGEDFTIKSVAHDISSGGAFVLLKNQELLSKTEISIEFIISVATIKKLYGFSSKVKMETDANIIRMTEEGIAVSFQGKHMKLSSLSFFNKEDTKYDQ